MEYVPESLSLRQNFLSGNVTFAPNTKEFGDVTGRNCSMTALIPDGEEIAFAASLHDGIAECFVNCCPPCEQIRLTTITTTITLKINLFDLSGKCFYVRFKLSHL